MKKEPMFESGEESIGCLWRVRSKKDHGNLSPNVPVFFDLMIAYDSADSFKVENDGLLCPDDLVVILSPCLNFAGGYYFRQVLCKLGVVWICPEHLSTRA
jgi:hypothetical protein